MDYKTQVIENAKNIAKILADALKIKQLPETTDGIKGDDSMALQRGEDTIQAKVSELPFASIIDLYGLNAFIKGGYYNVIGTYDYFVWVQEYIINGTYTNFYRSATLPVEAADLTYDRFDIIVINTSGLLFIKKGVASANPIEPEVDNLTELKIALIFVEANSVAPVGVTEVVVFNEGTGTAGGEFDITHSGSVLSAEQSSDGANSLKLVNKTSAFAISTLNYNGSELSNITMKVFLATATKNALRFSLWNVANARVGEVYINDGDYGFNAYLVNQWQTLSIPSTGFRTDAWESLQYNTLWINNNKASSTVYIDDIKIQQGLSQPTNSAITHTHSNYSLLESLTQTLVNAWNAASSWVTTNGANVLNHLANIANPHGVTKSQVGLGNADNTSDINKPISNATQTALNLKLDASAYNQHFKGVYLTLAALKAAHPTASVGDYAQVNEIGATNVLNYNWDAEENDWIPNAVVGSVANNTDELPEGTTNLYFTTARVLATVLTGISFLTGTAVVATDTVLEAFGKLQKQITDLTTAVGLNTAKVTNATHTGEVTGSGALTIESGVVDRDNLHVSLKTRITNAAVTGTYTLDHALGNDWKLTLTGITTIAESNLPTGTDTLEFTMKVTGNFGLTVPAYWTVLGDTYDGTIWNFFTVQIHKGDATQEATCFISNF